MGFIRYIYLISPVLSLVDASNMTCNTLGSTSKPRQPDLRSAAVSALAGDNCPTFNEILFATETLVNPETRLARDKTTAAIHDCVFHSTALRISRHSDINGDEIIPLPAFL